MSTSQAQSMSIKQAPAELELDEYEESSVKECRKILLNKVSISMRPLGVENGW